MTFEVILKFMKNLFLHNVDILEKLLKDWAVNKKYIAENDDFDILKLHFVTFNDLLVHTLFNGKKMCLLNINIHNFFFIKIGS